MGIKRLFVGAVLGFVLAACVGGEAEEASSPIPPTASTSPAGASDTSPSTTAADMEDVDSSAENETPTGLIVIGTPENLELTWATEGSVEADVEEAFWPALEAGRQVYAQSPLDPNWPLFVATHTGRELARVQAGIGRWIDDNQIAQYPEPSETLIESIALVSETEALLQVCEIDRAAFFVNGELTDDADFESEFQARFVLVDDRWLWEETIELVFEELPERETPACFNDSAAG